MIGFFLKKAFFDGWDNLISLVILNLGFLLVLAGFYGAMEVLTISTIGGIALLLLTLLFYAFYSGCLAYQTKEYAFYMKSDAKHFFSAVKVLWRHNLLFAFLNLIFFSLAFFVIPFYLSISTFLGLVVGVFLFWLAFLLILALFYFFPLAIQMPKDKPLKSLKKAFIIVADNLGFTLFFALYQLFNLVLSIFLATLIPGMAGLHLSGQGALKLLLLKYDYLEEHREVKRKKIPWDALLIEEREKVGPRSLKGMIFPWKD
ncbi:MAG: hypothetical protein WC224_08310 [Sphaerochaetaceae bacterium]